MSVLCSDWIIQHSLVSFSDSGGVSGPSDSGSRSTNGYTGEGELREDYIPKYSDIPCVNKNNLKRGEIKFYLQVVLINTTLWPKNRSR